ncbi:MAG: hypothetical protein Q8K45_21310 [Rubrivivax sp.]|nr:hypothetical protein [Rubrivivax sp.]
MQTATTSITKAEIRQALRHAEARRQHWQQVIDSTPPGAFVYIPLNSGHPLAGQQVYIRMRPVDDGHSSQAAIEALIRKAAWTAFEQQVAELMTLAMQGAAQYQPVAPGEFLAALPRLRQELHLALRASEAASAASAQSEQPSA